MNRLFPIFIVAAVLPFAATAAEIDSLEIEDSLVHLRSDGAREWSNFPEQAQAVELERTFASAANATTWTLSLRQQDVKQSWDVRLNGKSLGRLVRDEMDLRTDFTVPPGAVAEGDNRLEIRQTGRADPDDIRVGQVELWQVSPQQLRNQSIVHVAIVDDADRSLPGRITIVDASGTLIPVGAESGNGLAVREGVVYTANGNASFGVAAGRYRIFASRGFEYGIGAATVDVDQGEQVKRTFELIREVDTSGWVACDTHVHTVTHSGHGDCTIEERMATLAGEGIELPIATDHNKHIDYGPIAGKAGVRSQFTPVIGNEVTTKKGHFNVFPIRQGAAVVDHTQEDWGPLFDQIFATPRVRIAILNHGRDIHGGYRPFSPRHHISISGENLDGRIRRFNAMEVINSGAVQTDPRELFADWCGLVNRGLSITPVGCSDSHDVSRYIVGQGRTYIACDDSHPARIDVDAAVEAFLQGRVIVSYGLLTRLKVGGSHGPGQLLTPDGGEVVVEAEVHGPSWRSADSIELYLNGRRTEVSSIERRGGRKGSLIGKATWRIPRRQLRHDSWVTAVAHGPGVAGPHWQTAKPYQPDSPQFDPYTISFTGPVRIDADGDGRFSAPIDYARRLIEELSPDGEIAQVDAEQLAKRLDQFDASVIHQAMSLLQVAGVDPAQVQDAATDRVAAAIAVYRKSWRDSVSAQLEQIE